MSKTCIFYKIKIKNCHLLQYEDYDNHAHLCFYFQNQVITYQLVGDDTMPTYFDFDTNTGDIAVRQSLLQENRAFYVGRIVAYDAGSPPRSATVTAIINISRNLNRPIFSPTSYNETILETASSQTVIVRVTASDADRVVSRYLFNITKTGLYNFDPLKPHFYIVKLGFTGVYIIFLISAQNIDCG